jgi:glutathione peroxidase
MSCNICPCAIVAPAILGAAILFGGVQPTKTDPSTKPAPSAPSKPADKQPATDSKGAPKEDSAYVLGFTMNRIDGTSEDLAKYKGKVIVMVNTASQCGYTPQYEGLEKLYEERKDAGLVILGFPANNFGAQEPGTNKDIAKFCTDNFKVSFPMFEKISVKGADQHALYKKLTSQPAPIGGDPKWNFTKFVVDKSGKVVARFDAAKTEKKTDLEPALLKKVDELLGVKPEKKEKPAAKSPTAGS